MKVWEIFCASIKKNSLLKSKDKVVIAVSGGADSMCLLHLFWRLLKKTELNLIVVCFDHGLRKESKKELKIVEKFSQTLRIPFIKKTFDVSKYAKENSLSIETAGRDLRYEHLIKIAKEYKFNKIATAHNANDNAETVIMRILRGSGSLTGIPQKRKADKKIEIIRPLLSVKRKLIESYVKKHKIPFCNDKSNFSIKFTRNKVRLLLFPILEQINPLIVDHLFSLSEIQSRQETFLVEISQKLIKKCVRFGKKNIILDLDKVLRYNSVLSYRIIKEILPEKRNNFQINLIMQKILTSDLSPHRLSSNWIFQIKSNKGIFKRTK
jgi:tRNA(Ile)-lysidine synthase